ncbi:MAG: hypothetical protein ACI84D_002504 [Thalassolituus oleivorans]|jgi:hypothetical protein
MKKLLLLVTALALPLVSHAQKRVSEDDLVGEWKLVIHMDKKVDDAENALERMILKAVDGVLDEIDVRLVFEEDGEARVFVTAFSREADVDDDDVAWEITRHGGLVLGDNDHFDSDEMVFFMRSGDLVGYEVNADGKPAERKNVSLVRMTD